MLGPVSESLQAMAVQGGPTGLARRVSLLIAAALPDIEGGRGEFLLLTS